MTWSSFISLYVSLTKSTRPRFSAIGTSASLPLLWALSINCLPGIFMRLSPAGMHLRPASHPLVTLRYASIPARVHPSNNRYENAWSAGSARPARGPLRHGCARSGATGAVGLSGGGDPILLVDLPAAVRLPHPRHGHVYPSDPVRLTNVHVSPSRGLPTKSTRSPHRDALLHRRRNAANAVSILATHGKYPRSG